MKGTVAPSSRSSTAALTWAGLTESSEAICAMISILLYCLLTSESGHFPDMERAFKQYFCWFGVGYGPPTSGAVHPARPSPQQHTTNSQAKKKPARKRASLASV